MLLGRSGFVNLPFVVLDGGSSAVQQRVSCCYPHDAGTYALNCAVRGGDAACTPGCVFDPAESKDAGVVRVAA